MDYAVENEENGSSTLASPSEEAFDQSTLTIKQNQKGNIKGMIILNENNYPNES